MSFKWHLPSENRPSLVCLLALLMLFVTSAIRAQNAPRKFRVIAIAETGGIHQPFVDAAKLWLTKEAVLDNFSIDYIQDTDQINEAFLSQYQLFIQLNYPPYRWTPTAKAAFQRYIEGGKIGWIGFHHASLVGEFDGYPMWPWYHEFIGDIRWKNYIPTFSSAEVVVEARSHPAMEGVGKSFGIENEEWYTYDKSPRPNVHVLAGVDENTYTPSSPIKMGDHPVVWTNEHYKARNIYIFMGHHPELFQNQAYTKLVHNSILWAAQQ
jgi:type 1 glutamine amidotransferase